MKPIKHLFASVLTLLAIAFTAAAQFIAGPATGSALLTTTPILLPGVNTGSGLTNPPASLQQLIPIGERGVGFALTVLATNSLTVTNSYIVFEASVDGTYWADNATAVPKIVFPQNGSAVFTFYTNFQPTIANLANARYLRVKHITNMNSERFWITNFSWSAK